MQIYLVGGAVRDKLLGYLNYDKDWVVVGATPQQMLDQGFKPVGKDFPIFLHPQTREEYALARTERKVGPGYTGFTFYTAPEVGLEEDLRRRDLTINAMAEDAQGKLVDPFNGREDLRQKKLRHISPAFGEDPVRILRVARFCARYDHLGFTVAPETQMLMRQMVTSGEVDHLVPERIWKELGRALTEKHPEAFIRTLRECGALERIMPELNQLFETAPADAPNRETHCGKLTLAVIQQACALSESSEVRFAALTCLLNSTSIHTLCERLAVPKQHRNLAVAVAENYHQCQRVGELDAATIIQTLQTLDAFRRPEKFSRYLLCCKALGLAQGFTNYPQAPYFQGALDTCLKVTAKSVMQDGFRGKQLGDELRRRRIIAIEHYQQGQSPLSLH